MEAKAEEKCEGTSRNSDVRLGPSVTAMRSSFSTDEAPSHPDAPVGAHLFDAHTRTSAVHSIYNVILRDVHRSHLVVVRGSGLGSFAELRGRVIDGRRVYHHDAVGLVQDMIKKRVLREDDRSHLQWSHAFDHRLVALCFDSPAVVREILLRGPPTPQTALRLTEFRASRGQEVEQSVHSQSTAVSRSRPLVFPVTDVPVTSREDFCGRLIVEFGVGVQFVATETPRLCRDAGQLLQRLVWVHPPSPISGDGDSPQEVEAHLTRVLGILRKTMKSHGAHVHWIARERAPGQSIIIQLIPTGVVRQWLKTFNNDGRQRLQSITQHQFDRLADRVPRFTSFRFCRGHFAFLPRFDSIVGCEMPNCNRSHDMRDYVEFVDRVLREDGEEPIAMPPVGQAEEGQRRRRSRSRSPSPTRRRHRSRSRSRSRSPTGPSLSELHAFALESFDRVAGGLHLQPNVVDASTARFDPTLQAATTDAEAIMQRLVWTDPVGAPTAAEFGTEEDREFDLLQVIGQMTAPGLLLPEEIAWLARRFNSAGAPSPFVIIQLGPHAQMRTILSRLNRHTGECPFTSYLAWLFQATVARHPELARACGFYFEVMRARSWRSINHSCKRGDRCVKSHDPNLMTAILERARDDAIATSDADAVVISPPTSRSHASGIGEWMRSDATDSSPIASRPSSAPGHVTASPPAMSPMQSLPRDPLVTVLFDSHTLEPTSIVTTAVASAILTADAADHDHDRLLSVPMGVYLLAADRSELAKTGGLPPHRRWEDARHCIRVLAQCGLITTEDGLCAVTRGGAESDFRLTLRFGIRGAVKTVHDRFTRQMLMQQGDRVGSRGTPMMRGDDQTHGRLS